MTPTIALRSPSLVELATPLFIGANLAVFAAFAAGSLVAPQAFAAQLDITLGSASAIADFRAVYGGLSLGVGVLFALSLREVSLRPTAVLLATLTAGGLMLGRLITMVTDGMPGPLVLVFLGSEVIAVAVGLVLLTRK